MKIYLDYYDGCCMVYIGEEVYYTVAPCVVPQPESFDGPACEECGKEIPKARLEALPHTTTCVGCSAVQRYQADSRLGEITIARTEEELRRMGLHYE